MQGGREKISYLCYNLRMFTGIIEEIGTIKGITTTTTGAAIVVECSKVLNGTQIGDSIAINGCCQTVSAMTGNTFTADVSLETLNVTTFNSFIAGRRVNLERALTPSTRMGGHIVQGHVDCVGKYLGNMSFGIPKTETQYIVHKGSITIDGVSLTVAKIEDNVFHIAIIPHTLENTVLKELRAGESVNIETDILGKYIEKLLSTQNNSSKITSTFLEENGFY